MRWKKKKQQKKGKWGKKKERKPNNCDKHKGFF